MRLGKFAAVTFLLVSAALGEEAEPFEPDVFEEESAPPESAPESSASVTIELEDPSENLLSDDLQNIKVQESSYDFQAETDRLMDIIVHSLYTERDVFLRELVSNGADALEKVRISHLLEKESAGQRKVKSSSSDEDEPSDDELKIMVKLNKQRNEISIIDNGIGMSREELEKNLGTVARSGTSQFVEAAKGGESASNLIGQFGVGFYSSFLVAEEVTVISKRAEDKHRHIWQSRAKGGFSVARDTRDLPGFEHGTIVTLKLKEDAKELYTDKYKIKFILQRFSAFVPFPIYLGEVRSGEAAKVSPKIKWQRTNANKPVWLRDKNDISDEEYVDFYKNFTRLGMPPMAWTHFKAEGDYEFNGLFYLPIKLPNVPSAAQVGSDIKLYVQRVLITDNLNDFLPRNLQFVKGVVDSNDLPLKVDRENFSQMKVMRVMKKKAFTKVFEMFNKIVRDGKSEKARVEEEITILKRKELELTEPAPPKSLLEMLNDVHEDFPKYSKFNAFWQMYGDQILTGCVEQDVNRKEKDKIMNIYHAHSTYGNKLLTSLADYASRMLPGQRSIYILTGDNIDLMMKSPYVEFFLKHGVEVLLVTGPYDEQCLMQLLTWKRYDLISVEMDQMLKVPDLAFAVVNSNIKAGKYDDESSFSDDSIPDISTTPAWKKHQAQVIEDFKIQQFGFNIMYKPLLNWFNKRLGKQFNGEIRISLTLPESPARIAIPFNGFTASHERLARTTINVDKHMVEDTMKNKNLDLNPHHPIISHLLQEVKAIVELRKSAKQQSSEESAALLERERKVNHMVDMLYESALVSCGFLSRKPYLLLEDFYRLIQAENVATGSLPLTVEIPDDIMQQARLKVLGHRADSDDDDEEEAMDMDDDWFHEKDEL